jgi:hypothetical protein
MSLYSNVTSKLLETIKNSFVQQKYPRFLNKEHNTFVKNSKIDLNEPPIDGENEDGSWGFHLYDPKRNVFIILPSSSKDTFLK